MSGGRHASIAGGTTSLTEFENPPDHIIREILSRRLTIAVVGCSPNPARDSHRIAALLREKGHDVLPINPVVQEVMGLPCYPSLLDAPLPIQMVDIFRRSSEVAPVVGDAIRIKAEIVWMQLGVIDEAVAVWARDCGLTVIMDRCPAIEYRRLFA